ncbi:hypothetical protein BJY01DRAFT_219250 [Aspergillus pseudoustus]|uniref:Uncharacterized protein n=1 Tax=Aspergillus pseudoustus TaxID=1810923 RepID=A0ABR4JI35_9EURO
MPLPPELEKLIWTKRFWTEYFSLEPEDDSPWNQQGSALVTIPVGSGYSLTLEFRLSSPSDLTLKYVSPSNPDPIDLGRNGYCGAPHLLRWSELPLISRAAAVLDAEAFPHPHLVVLLLSRFTPICVGDNAEEIASMVHDVLSKIGFSYKDILLALRSIDHRSADFRWRYDDVIQGWVLQQYRGYTTGKWLATLRATDNVDFPFDEWPAFLAAAEEPARSAPSEHNPRNVGGIASTPIYNLPVQHTLYLKVPVGTAPHRLFPQAYTPLNRVLSRILQDLNMGDSRCCFSDEVQLEDGSVVERSFQLEMSLFGELAPCQRVVRDALLWLGAPVETVLHDLKGSKRSQRYLLKEPEHTNAADSASEVPVYLVLGKVGALYTQNGAPAAQATDGSSCSELVRDALVEAGASTDPGNASILATQDGGNIRFLQVGNAKQQRGDLVTIALYRVTLQVAQFLYRLLLDGDLALLPALITTKADVVEKLRPERGEGEGSTYPSVVVGSDEELFSILEEGAYKWWSNKAT